MTSPGTRPARWPALAPRPRQAAAGLLAVYLWTGLALLAMHWPGL
jgi:hypothetical protein